MEVRVLPGAPNSLGHQAFGVVEGLSVKLHLGPTSNFRSPAVLIATRWGSCIRTKAASASHFRADRQLLALAGAARPGGALVPHNTAREAGQNWRPACPAWPICDLSAGRGDGAVCPVRHDPAPDRQLARAARCGGLTGGER